MLSNDDIKKELENLNPAISVMIEDGNLKTKVKEEENGLSGDKLIYYNEEKKKKITIDGLSLKIVQLYNQNDNDSFIKFVLEEFIQNEKENIREITRNFINQKWYIKEVCLYTSLNELSSSSYEKSPAKGKILIAPKELIENGIELIIKLSEKIPLCETRMLRKFLETTGNNLYMISDGEKILGLGRINEFFDKTEKIYVITFLGKNHYKLSKLALQTSKNHTDNIRDNVLSYEIIEEDRLNIVNELPKLYETEFQEKDFSESLTLIFGKKIENYKNAFLEVARKLSSQKKGTMLVISEQADSEIKDLKDYGIMIEKTKIDKEFLLNLSSIDGAVLMDTETNLCGLGVILDGLAKGSKGRADRGARYNSALKYISKFDNKSECKTLIMVVSEDGMVDLLPNKREIDRQLSEIKNLVSSKKFDKKEINDKLKKLMENYPEYYMVFYTAAAFHYFIDEKDDSIRKLEKAIELNKYDDNLYRVKGLILKEKGKNEDALKNFNKAIELNSNNSNIYFHKAYLLAEMDRNEEALINYNEALKLNPSDENIYNNRGIILKENGKKEEALNDYNKAIELNPNDSVFYNNRGVLLSEMGRKEEALNDYNKALELNPSDTKAKNNRKIILEKIKNETKLQNNSK